MAVIPYLPILFTISFSPNWSSDYNIHHSYFAYCFQISFIFLSVSCLFCNLTCSATFALEGQIICSTIKEISSLGAND